jgi:acetylornithine deacetylase/succinyl-diaminopimelate desuccinylase-like protein
VRTLDNAVHSGLFGGAIPDALMSLTRVLASLHDDDGDVAVAGLVSSDADPLDLTEEELRAQAGAVAGLEILGSGSLTTRLWRKPAISIVAIDAPPINEAINQLVAVARAKVSIRIAPGDDPERAMAALRDHLEGSAPWGAEITVTEGATGEAIDLDTTGPGYAAFRTAFEIAYGEKPVEIGVGGSIPFVASFAEASPEADILLTGVADPTSAAHGPNESLDLDDFRRGILAEAIAFEILADTAAGPD